MKQEDKKAMIRNRYNCPKHQTERNTYNLRRPVPVAQSVECPLRGTRGHGVDLESRHTKVVKIVLAALRLALRRTG